jgi:D-glycero-D-manno-heptose 1,7-bisphosphate phosphatase
MTSPYTARTTRRAVFLDRDGVLNRAIVRAGQPCPPRDTEEVEILPGAEAACRALRQAGFLLIVVTNQPDVARGTQTRAGVDAINEIVRGRLELDDVCVCPHDDADDCPCRKPRPGLVLEAARQWNIDLAASVVVGDRWRDIGAGRAAGCRTVFIDYGYAEQQQQEADVVVQSLAEAVPWIVELSR